MSVFRRDGTVNTALGVGLSGVQVYVCTQPANTGSIPPSPLASIFSDPAGLVPLANPVLTDGLGNYFFYAAPGTYTIVVYDPLQRIVTQIFPDQAVVTPGGGSVTSVGLSMPGEFSVTNSPITSSGSLTVNKANQNANTVYAGPSGGGAAAPGFRSLVSADLPAGVGSVTSVAATLTGSALLSLAVSGSPITTSGTIGLTVNFANQNANTVLAGPSSGAAGPVTARALVAADIFARVVVPFGATVQFNAASAASPTFDLTLTGDVSSSTIINPTDGQVARFIIRQDGTGGHAFPWPTNAKGHSSVSVDPNTSSVQEFVYESSNTVWRAISPGMVSTTTGAE